MITHYINPESFRIFKFLSAIVVVICLNGMAQSNDCFISQTEVNLLDSLLLEFDQAGVIEVLSRIENQLKVDRYGTGCFEKFRSFRGGYDQLFEYWEAHNRQGGEYVYELVRGTSSNNNRFRTEYAGKKANLAFQKSAAHAADNAVLEALKYYHVAYFF